MNKYNRTAALLGSLHLTKLRHDHIVSSHYVGLWMVTLLILTFAGPQSGWLRWVMMALLLIIFLGELAISISTKSRITSAESKLFDAVNNLDEEE